VSKRRDHGKIARAREPKNCFVEEKKVRWFKGELRRKGREAERFPEVCRQTNKRRTIVKKENELGHRGEKRPPYKGGPETDAPCKKKKVIEGEKTGRHRTAGKRSPTTKKENVSQ